jgi:hypothetical protein
VTRASQAFHHSRANATHAASDQCDALRHCAIPKKNSN